MIREEKITINGLAINTYINGEGNNTIVFVHGNSSSGSSWYDQLNDKKLASKYQLISFDLPGHGKSGESETYNMNQLATFFYDLIKELKLSHYIVVALSFGTCVAAEAAPRLKDCNGYLMVSPNITSNEYNPSVYMIPFPQMVAIMSPSVSDDDLTKVAEHLVHESKSSIMAKYKTDYLQTDPRFRTAVGEMIRESAWSDEYKNLIDSEVPVCLVFGKEERVIKTDYLDHYPNKWRNKVFLVNNAAHFVNAEQPEIFNRLLLDFAEDVFK